MRLAAAVVALSFALRLTTVVGAQEYEPASATLLVAQTAATPGSTVPLGIKFQMRPRWHVYWQNPGDSGEPPKVTWHLPEGYKVAGLQWPAPIRLQSSAGVDYGYEDQLVLVAGVSIPQETKAGTTVDVAGDLRWVTCHDVCIPQKATIHAPLKIATAAAADERATSALESATQRLPKPLPRSISVNVTSQGEAFALHIVSAGRIYKALFFPSDSDVVRNDATQVIARNNRGVTVTLRKSERLQREPERLRGLLVLDESRSYIVDAPVRVTGAK